jgi:4-oxalocrotonate tautomerase
MPLVRIDLPRGKPEDYRRAVADVVYTAMTTVLAVPAAAAERAPLRSPRA